ncbi:MAG: hypothetical protein XE08_0396 [Parcubacteria bacterium 32_520]|nr:MAG: hypothetical protein XE08_0396 [Parcubacteria bacterium 32_520]
MIFAKLKKRYKKILTLFDNWNDGTTNWMKRPEGRILG